MRHQSPKKVNSTHYVDEAIIQAELEKLLKEIRAEIRYAESCAEFGECFISSVSRWSDDYTPTNSPTFRRYYKPSEIKSQEDDSPRSHTSLLSRINEKRDNYPG